MHEHPETKEVVYVGKGSGGRAWDTTRNRYNINTEHKEWMYTLMLQGYVPSDWVDVVDSGLTEEEAFKIETSYRWEYGSPKFDKTSGQKNHRAKLTDEQAREIYKRAQQKENHELLAKEFGVCRTVVSMINTRKQWKAATACLV